MEAKRNRPREEMVLRWKKELSVLNACKIMTKTCQLHLRIYRSFVTLMRDVLVEL